MCQAKMPDDISYKNTIASEDNIDQSIHHIYLRYLYLNVIREFRKKFQNILASMAMNGRRYII